jgi:hydroxymethylpyrimidine pyrophosphatase-like HAD family hydrolase
MVGRRWDSSLDAITDPLLKVVVVGTGLLHADFREGSDLGIRTLRSNPTYWEISSAEVEAEKGLRWISTVAYPGRSTIAVGDGANDVAMLKFAACSFTFADADATVRDAASRVLECSPKRSLLGVLSYLQDRLSERAV